VTPLRDPEAGMAAVLLGLEKKRSLRGGGRCLKMKEMEVMKKRRGEARR